jgi:hypothetical protein
MLFVSLVTKESNSIQNGKKIYREDAKDAKDVKKKFIIQVFLAIFATLRFKGLNPVVQGRIGPVYASLSCLNETLPAACRSSDPSRTTLITNRRDLVIFHDYRHFSHTI